MLDDLMRSGPYEEMKWKAQDRILWKRVINLLWCRTPKEEEKELK